jgi:protein-arginine kinase activator protein McsA
MKKIHKVEKTVEEEETICDICHCTFDKEESQGVIYAIQYPRYSHEEVSTIGGVDVCYECFEDKIVPLLQKEFKIKFE